MTDQPSSGIRTAVRLLATLSGLVLAAIGFVIWRVSPVMLEVYREFGMPKTWRQQALSRMGSLLVFGGILLFSAILTVMTWRLPTARALWLTICSVVLTWAALVATAWFYFSLTSYPATSMEMISQ